MIYFIFVVVVVVVAVIFYEVGVWVEHSRSELLAHAVGQADMELQHAAGALYDYANNNRGFISSSDCKGAYEAILRALEKLRNGDYMRRTFR